jgi:hypothetical protein
MRPPACVLQHASSSQPSKHMHKYSHIVIRKLPRWPCYTPRSYLWENQRHVLYHQMARACCCQQCFDQRRYCLLMQRELVLGVRWELPHWCLWCCCCLCLRMLLTSRASVGMCARVMLRVYMHVYIYTCVYIYVYGRRLICVRNINIPILQASEAAHMYTKSVENKRVYVRHTYNILIL